MPQIYFEYYIGDLMPCKASQGLRGHDQQINIRLFMRLPACE